MVEQEVREWLDEDRDRQISVYSWRKVTGELHWTCRLMDVSGRRATAQHNGVTAGAAIRGAISQWHEKERKPPEVDYDRL